MDAKEMIIQTTTEVQNLQLRDLTGQEIYVPVNMSFNLKDVVAIREALMDNEYEIDSSRCFIYLKSGEYFIIYTPYETILELYNTL
jgi:hypothetical protein